MQNWKISSPPPGNGIENILMDILQPFGVQGSGFRVQKTKFQGVYDYAACVRAVIRAFIKANQRKVNFFFVFMQILYLSDTIFAVNYVYEKYNGLQK